MRFPKKRIALLGFGAIGQAVVAALAHDGAMDALVGVLARSEPAAARARWAGLSEKGIVADLESLLRLEPDLVIEAAGHGAVSAYGVNIVRRGHDLLLSSIGALADRAVARMLVAAADGPADIWAASGAVAGLDGLLAARTAGLSTVSYMSVKAPSAWAGTAAEERVDLPGLKARTIFFEGTAREAALAFPRNANVGATIALAGLGLDRTKICLAADPNVPGPLGIIDASGAFGHLRCEILALASPENPKTSLITGHSLAAAATHGMRFRVLPALTAL
jgi:aspartate dehydrogenase